jgi:hypothetical protein
VRLRADLLNWPVAWTGCVSAWQGAPVCIKLFYALCKPLNMPDLASGARLGLLL